MARKDKPENRHRGIAVMFYISHAADREAVRLAREQDRSKSSVLRQIIEGRLAKA